MTAKGGGFIFAASFEGVVIEQQINPSYFWSWLAKSGRVIFKKLVSKITLVGKFFMSENIARELIFEWAYNDVVIDMYESGDDGDAAIFESTVMSIFGAKGLLEFAADPKCPSRLYFAKLLLHSFLCMFRRGTKLPFHFSRFRGIMSRDEYRQELLRREDELYELCLVLDSMRAINDSAIKSLYKQVLDFRHDQRGGDSRFYYECRARLDFKLFE